MSFATEDISLLAESKSTAKIDLEAKDLQTNHQEENIQELIENTKKRTTEDLECDDETASENIEQPLSKKQRKKLLKQQRYEEIKKKRILKRKEKKRLKREQRELEGHNEINTQRDHPIIKYRTMDSPDAYPLKVAIDLSFDHLMSDKDICKLTKQLQRCYSLNRRALHPLQLYFTSFGDKCKTRFDNDLKGHYVSWDIHIKADHLTEVFPKEDIIYLSAESPNVLKEIDMSKTYIIGGLVDHNHHKGLCYDLAVANGIGHAQLPINEYFKMTTRTVMTVNQVYEIIMYFTESKDWQDAFNKVMPQRKIIPKGKKRQKNRKTLEEDGRKDESESNGIDGNSVQSLS